MNGRKGTLNNSGANQCILFKNEQKYQVKYNLSPKFLIYNAFR